MLKEFKEFAMRGNVIDLAVAVVIGAAFNKIVGSLVDDVIMPIIGIFGKADFSNYFLPLPAPSPPPTSSTRGSRAACWPMAISSPTSSNFSSSPRRCSSSSRAMNAMKKPEAAAPAAPPPPSDEVVLLTQIRDALVKR